MDPRDRVAGVVAHRRTHASTGLVSWWLLPVALVTALLTFVPLTRARAHGAEADIPAKTLVEQGIAIIRTQPDQMDAIADKIKDALDSKDPTGVDLALVGQAQTAFEAGDLSQTELLLEQAIGLTPGSPVISPNEQPRQQPSSIASSEPANHLQALAGSPLGGTAEVVLLAGAGVLALVGLALAALVGLALARKYR